MTAKKIFTIIYQVLLHLLALFGLVLLLGYLAVYFKITDVPGGVDANNKFYKNNTKTYKQNIKASNTPQSAISDLENQVVDLANVIRAKKTNLCKIGVVRKHYPNNSPVLTDIYNTENSEKLLNKMLIAAEVRLQENKKVYEEYTSCESSFTNITNQEKLPKTDTASSTNLYSWIDTEEWENIKKAITKDEAVIKSAAAAAKVDPRTIVSICIVEQFRLYFTQRELYEKIFKPLTILASANKMAWGVMSIKEKTAIEIERNLKDPTSVFYPGQEYTNLLDFASLDISSERYNRLSSEKDHYYSYLYSGLYIKEILNQWNTAGFNIDDRPEIIATLFNIGFKNSAPKENALVGGSTIDINNTKYTFGSLAYEFYYSGEMSDIFGYSE